MSPAVAIVAALVGCREEEPEKPPPAPAPEPLPELEWSPEEHPDSDRDGWPDSEDCAPYDVFVHPEAAERCNDADDNCDGVGDDQDGDGWLWCEDCDDGDADSWPGAPDDLGDHVDQDCDGTDGVGQLMQASLTGDAELAWFGYALAAGDSDSDGCAELLVGQPGIVYVLTLPDSAVLSNGCWPWASTTVRPGNAEYRGYTVDIAGDLLVVHDDAINGRLSLFDAATFRTGEEPLLEIEGSASRAIDSVALLGDPPAWLIWGRQGSFPPNETYYGLVALPREGVLDLAQTDLDHIVRTDSQFFADGDHVGDVGDRDGDGQVDLGFGQQWQEDNSVYFFPAPTSGHLLDAPEVWRKGNGTVFDTRWVVTGDADLDGDGADDAIVADSNAHVDALPNGGRVYLAPWLGPGERMLMDAPARIDGEREWDWTGISSAAGDLDGDGQADLVVGAPGGWDSVSRPGQVMVFPGPLSGVQTRTDAAAVWVGSQPDEHAGYSLALGDLDGSGKLDLAVGAPLASTGALLQTGAVYVVIDPL